MHAVLTGAETFLGEAVLHELLARGRRVKIIAPKSADLSHLEDLDVTIIRVGLGSPEWLRGPLAGASELYHCAGSADPFTGTEDEHHASNYTSTRALLNAAAEHHLKKVIITGGADVAARLPTPAARSRARAISDAVRLAEAGALNGAQVIGVHPGVLVGAGDRTPTPVGRLLLEHGAGTLRWLPSGGIPYIDVADAGRGIVEIAQSGEGGAEYTLSAGYASAAELFNAVGKMTGRDPIRPRLPARLALGAAFNDRARAAVLRRKPSVPPALVRLFNTPRRAFLPAAAPVEALSFGTLKPLDHSLAEALAWWKDAGLLRVE